MLIVLCPNTNHQFIQQAADCCRRACANNLYLQYLAPRFGNYLFQHSQQLFCKWLPYHYKSVLFQFVVGNARTSLLCIMAQCLNTLYKELQIAFTNEDEELQIN